MSLRSKVTPTEKPRRVFCPGPCPFSYRQVTDLCSETGSSKWVCGSKVTPTEKPRRSSAPGPCPFIYKLLIFALKLVLPSKVSLLGDRDEETQTFFCLWSLPIQLQITDLCSETGSSMWVCSPRWHRPRHSGVFCPWSLSIQLQTSYWSLLWNWFFQVSLRVQGDTDEETQTFFCPWSLSIQLQTSYWSLLWNWFFQVSLLSTVTPTETPRCLLPLVLVHSATDKLLIFALELVLPSESALHGDTDRDTQVSSAPGSCPFRHRLITLYCRLKGLKVVQFTSWVELGQGRRGRGGKMQYPDPSFFALNVPATAISQTAFTK